MILQANVGFGSLAVHGVVHEVCSNFQDPHPFFPVIYRVSQKKCPFVEKRPYLPSNSSKMQKLGVFWKIQDICYIMGTEICKIEEEMTEKMKPQVANPLSKNGQNSLLSIYID